MIKTFLLRLGCIGLLSMACAGALSAQIEEVVVTAQKKTQDAQDIPFGISVMNDEKINEIFAGGADVLALAAQLPSLYVESSNGRLAPRFYIRGIGNVDFDVNASQPISLVYDEMVLENPTAKSFPLFDIERVEILRGPQGTLFGRNTTAGIVKFDSFKPTASYENALEAGIGNFGFRSLTGFVNRPLSEAGPNMRISFLYQGEGDWIDNTAPGLEAMDVLGGFQDLATRIQFAWTQNDRTKVLVNFHIRKLLEGTPTIFYGNAIQQGSNELVDGFDREKVGLDAYEHIEQEATQIGAITKIERSYEQFEVVFISGIHSIMKSRSRGDIDGGYGSVFGGVLPSGPPPGIPFDAQTQDGIPHHSQYSLELRFEGNHSGRDWRAGLYTFFEDLKVATLNFATIDGPDPTNGFVIQRQDTVATALYGTYQLINNEAWDLTAGGRYTHDRKQLAAGRLISPLSAFGVGPIRPDPVEPSASVFTWDLSALHHKSDHVHWFWRVARGYRAPSIQGRLLFQDTISVGEAEHGMSYEFGFKRFLLDRRLRFDATIYKFQIQDFQLTKIGGSANISTLINADQVDGEGLELELEYFVSANLLIDFGLGINLTEINDPDLSVNGCGSANLLYGCTVTDPELPNGEYLIHGNSLYNAPEVIGQVSIRYEKPLATGVLSFSTDWTYTSELRYALYESIEFSKDPTLEGGIRVGYQTGNNKHRVGFYIRNVTDQQSQIGGIDFNNLTAMLDEPRKVGLTWRVSY